MYLKCTSTSLKMSKRLRAEIRDINRKGNVYYVVEGNWDDEEKMSFTVRMAVPNSKLNATVNVKVPKDYPFKPPDLKTMELQLYDGSFAPVKDSYSKGKEAIARKMCDSNVVDGNECTKIMQLFDYYDGREGGMYNALTRLPEIIDNIIFPIVTFYSRLFEKGEGGNLNDALLESKQKMLKL